MSYQSEAQLERQLIEQLKSQNYEEAVIQDYDSLSEHSLKSSIVQNSEEKRFLIKSGSVFSTLLTARVSLKAVKYCEINFR